MDSHLVDINVKYHQKYHYGCLLLAAGDPSYSLIMGQHAEGCWQRAKELAYEVTTQVQ
jgi:hypothetical protein